MSSREQAGMTLLELMVATAVMTSMMFVTWSVITNTAEAKRSVEAQLERDHEIRVALDRIIRDLEGAYLSTNENQNLEDRRTMFVGKDKSDFDELRFSSLTHTVLWADADESEQTLIAYLEEPDPKDSSKTNILRWESRRLSNEDWEDEPAEVDLLLRDVASLDFSFYDARDTNWQDKWDSTNADGERGRLPAYIKVQIEIPTAESRKNIVFSSQARPLLQEQLRFFNN